MQTVVFGALFEPRSIAAAACSAHAVSGRSRFRRTLQACGYAGRIDPVHPTATHIAGLPAIPSLEALPVQVDYAYVATAAQREPEVIRSGRGAVRVAQVMSSGFGENA